jgi:hypothetical protein
MGLFDMTEHGLLLVLGLWQCYKPTGPRTEDKEVQGVSMASNKKQVVETPVSLERSQDRHCKPRIGTLTKKKKRLRRGQWVFM